MLAEITPSLSGLSPQFLSSSELIFESGGDSGGIGGML